MKKDETEFNPKRMLWVVAITHIIIILLFLAILATISYFGHGGMLN